MLLSLRVQCLQVTVLLLVTAASTVALAFQQPVRKVLSRHEVLQQIGSVAAATLCLPQMARASGGATAGKYTYVPVHIIAYLLP
jgi:hypothetical protein